MQNSEYDPNHSLRFSHSSPPSIWRRVKGARTIGTGPLRVGIPQGSFFEVPVGPDKVLGEMLGESLSQVESSSHVVSSSPIWTSTERTPSPF